MTWIVELLEQAQEFFDELASDEQVRVAGAMRMLEAHGPTLGRPHVDRLKGSRHKNLKELRVQCGDKQFRILFAFDRKRSAVLLLGGDKLAYGVDRFYVDLIPIAEDLFDAHLERTAAAATSVKKTAAKKTRGRKT
ncbi:type II toxin-antitoxin system RelE/ParE family toxin [Xanthomonas campestris]|uniref:type II toxin-antitoxin system RelE/ParE family toxin n=1 Tax=Xanthomonas campestris TaxID=339 RepID=UPI001E2BB72F|nr:type II toxin-antitoxin system RelE/ParE family toxin [Xanthomonas campestris]MCC5070829.1 type II toxin-antitoxin system RelE/ParE family toxin [Xanthomonas campestris pv. plantaginis]